MKNTGARGGAINGARRRSEENDLDDVEKLLQSAQDELILKLSIDSHNTSSSSPNFNLHPDLHRRFQALRSQPSSSIAPPPIRPDIKSKNLRAGDDEESKAVLGDDLSARFAALKSSISNPDPLVLPQEADSSKRSFDVGEGDEDEEDEVERLIRWAKDAARLDPSPPSDSDVEDEEDQIDSPPSSSDEDEVSQNQTKKKMKKKKDPRESNSKK